MKKSTLFTLILTLCPIVGLNFTTMKAMDISEYDSSDAEKERTALILLNLSRANHCTPLDPALVMPSQTSSRQPQLHTPSPPEKPKKRRQKKASTPQTKRQHQTVNFSPKNLLHFIQAVDYASLEELLYDSEKNHNFPLKDRVRYILEADMQEEFSDDNFAQMCDLLKKTIAKLPAHDQLTPPQLSTSLDSNH